MTTGRSFSRRRVLAGGIAAGALAAPSLACAQEIRWRMVTSWPKRLPGPGMSASAPLVKPKFVAKPRNADQAAFISSNVWRWPMKSIASFRVERNRASASCFPRE